MSARILVVEDEAALTTLLQYNLDAEGYSSATAKYEVRSVEMGDRIEISSIINSFEDGDLSPLFRQWSRSNGL